MKNEWLQCIVTFIRKNKDPLNLENYRTIALLDMIYKIWASVCGNILTPLLNLLTDEARTAYKPNRSTLGGLPHVENEVKQSITNQLIIIDPPKHLAVKNGESSGLYYMKKE